jgi:hypothetical protein
MERKGEPMKTRKSSVTKVARALTGISTPIFGVSWNPPKDRQEIARRFVTFLEDRRALYQPYHMENGSWVTDSILEIRRELTKTIQDCPQEAQLVEPLRAMRAACRKYLDETDPRSRRIHNPYGGDLLFASALGELRGVFGLHLARLCVAYGIDVEDELASIFPVADDEHDRDDKRGPVGKT